MAEHRHTYKHALSISETINRIFEYESQESSLSEILQLVVEQAKSNYQEALTDPKQKADMAGLKNGLELAEQERDLAREVSIELNTAADNLRQGGTHEYLVLSERNHHRLEPHFTKESLYLWAKNLHNFDISQWASSEQGVRTYENKRQHPAQEESSTNWQETSIRFMAKNKIIVSTNGTEMTKNLAETMLINKRTMELNTAGLALLGLADQKSIAQKKQGTSMGVSKKVLSELRKALQSLSGIPGNPFFEYNPADGWIPRFTVVDRRNA